MRRFVQLLAELEAATTRQERADSLARCLREADRADAAWGVWLLAGAAGADGWRPTPRCATRAELRTWACEVAGLPRWLIEECRGVVGDASETWALILPETASAREMPLAELVATRVHALRGRDAASRRAVVTETWSLLSAAERVVYNKLLEGRLLVGAGRALCARALGQIAGVAPGEMEHRLMQPWAPTPAGLEHLLRPSAHGGGEGGLETGQPGGCGPFAFGRVHRLDASVADGPMEALAELLGPVEDWQAEWKWDGLRAQMIGGLHGRGPALWSRAEEVVDDRFAELADAASTLPAGTVLDGEVLAWDAGAAGGRGAPLPLMALRRRLERRAQGGLLFYDPPCVYMASDLLAVEGRDVRGWSTARRREALERMASAWEARGSRLRLSPIVRGGSWQALARERTRARELGVEGLVLKPLAAAYDQTSDHQVAATQAASGSGRACSRWWAWSVKPWSVCAVLIGAQLDRGRRGWQAVPGAEYTLGLWSGGAPGEGGLVPVARARAGLSEADAGRLEEFVRDRPSASGGAERGRGGYRGIAPAMVFELQFDAVTESTRHRSGLSLRHARIARWLRDKPAAAADTVASLRALVRGTAHAAPLDGSGS